MVRRELKALTGLRGVAALLVAAYHFTLLKDATLAPRFQIAGGYLAVDCFFILSGFVMAYNYTYIFSEHVNARDYAGFLIKRVIRIYPAYLAVIALAFAKILANVSGDGALAGFTRWDVTANLFMIAGLASRTRRLIGPSWSVTAELFCYFILPFVLLASTRSRLTFIWIPLAAIAGWGLVMCSGENYEGGLDVIGGGVLPTLRALSGVLMGVLVYRASIAKVGVIGSYSNQMVAITIILIVTLWSTGASDLLKVLILGLLVLGLADERWLGSALFSNRIVYYLGEISYSIYLVHAMLVSMMLKIGEKLSHYLPVAVAYWACFLLYLLVSIALASILYPVVERGAKKALTPWVARLSKRLTDPIEFRGGDTISDGTPAAARSTNL